MLSRRSSCDRRYFTLIEVMIAFGLVALLISTLMGFYWQMNQLQVEGDIMRRQAFHLRLLQRRLSEVMPRAVEPTQAPSTKDVVPGAADKKEPEIPEAFFYISERDEVEVLSAPSLVFSYDNGTDLDPLFCNVVLARLYHVKKDGRGELWLATWPRPTCSMNAALARRELLMPNVRGIAFECFQPPKLILPASVNDAIADAVQAAQGPPENTWSRTWRLDYRKLPAMIKITITPESERGEKQSQPLTFFFPFPNSTQPITIIQ